MFERLTFGVVVFPAGYVCGATRTGSSCSSSSSGSRQCAFVSLHSLACRSLLALPLWEIGLADLDLLLDWLGAMIRWLNDSGSIFVEQL